MAVILLAVAVAVLLVVSVAATAALYQVVRQRGTLLLRIEALEQASRSDSQAGLPVGLAVGDIRLPDFAGRMICVDEVPAAQVLLIRWNPSSKLCELIARELGRVRASLRQHATELVLIADGDVERNRRLDLEHGLGPYILLQDDSPPVAAFVGLEPPAAYVLDLDRRITEPVAVGADAVLALAQSLVAREEVNAARGLAAA